MKLDFISIQLQMEIYILLIDSSNDRGTVDGITKDAKIERPTQAFSSLRQLYILRIKIK